MDNTGAGEDALSASARLEGFCIDYRMQKTGRRYDLYVQSSDGGRVCIPDITRDGGDAKALLEILSAGAVFPQNITEVMDDLLADGASFD